MSTVLGQRTLPHEEPGPWWPWLAVAAGLLLLYVPTYASLAHTLWRDDAYAHGPIMLALFAWLVWRDRAALQEEGGTRAPVVGGLLVAAGLALYIVGRTQSLVLFEAASLLPVIGGTLLILRGWSGLQRFGFALALLLFVIPLPGFILDAITAPLKTFVSASVATLLHALGYPIERAGVMLQVGDHQLLVADACSGMNSIYSLLALAFVYVHLTGPARRMRLPLVLLAVVPIAVLANIVRVAVLALVTYHFGDAAAEGFLHGFAGMLVFVIAVLMLVAWDKTLTPTLSPAPIRSHEAALTQDAALTPTLSQGRGRLAQGTGGTAALVLTCAFVGAAVAAPMLRPLPADTSGVNLETMLPREFAGWRIDPASVPIAPAPDVKANLDRIYNQI